MDKLSILCRKVYFGEDVAVKELIYLEDGLGAYGINGQLITGVIRLSQMNFEIWNLENEMRRSQKEEYTQEELAEYGSKAIKIRNLNRKRVQYKNHITELYDGFREAKVNHRSQ